MGKKPWMKWRLVLLITVVMYIVYTIESNQQDKYKAMHDYQRSQHDTRPATVP